MVAKTTMTTRLRAQFTTELPDFASQKTAGWEPIPRRIIGILTESAGETKAVARSLGTTLQISSAQMPLFLFFSGIARSPFPLSPLPAMGSVRPSSFNPSPVADFRRAFLRDPGQAVAALRENVATKKLSPEDAAAILLPYLVKASYAQQSLVEETLESVASPKQILNAALGLHEKNHDKRLLAIADSLLVRNGASSWSVLKALCDSNRKECRHFVNTVATMDAVPEAERRESLLRLASNPDLETRQEVLAAIEAGVLEEPLPVWEALARDPNDDIATTAADQVAVLAE